MQKKCIWESTINIEVLLKVAHHTKSSHSCELVREDFLYSINFVDINVYLSFKLIFSTRFVFVTSNMKYWKFENMASNQLFMHLDAKDAIFCKQCILTERSLESSDFTGGYRLSVIAKNYADWLPLSLWYFACIGNC